MPDTAGKTYDAYGNMNLQHDKRFIIKVYDSTVNPGTEAQQLAHVALINVDFDNNDTRAPFIALADFGKEYISGGGDYPVLANNADRTERALPNTEYTKNVVTETTGRKKGYVQYAEHSTPNTTANVSGMVIFKGKAADNNRIQRITAQISYYPTNSATPAAFDIATWSTVNNTLEPAAGTDTIISMRTADNARGFEEENPSLTLDYSHVVNWNFAWDTSTVTDIARDNVTVIFTVYDANGNNAPASTTVNIVPYIAEVITPLTAANSANPSAFNRSALGWYPVREDDYIHIRGFNFNGGSTGVQVNGTTLNGIAAATAGANVGGITVPSGVRTSTYITARVDSDATAGNATNAITSGALVLTVNSIQSFNNRNNDAPAYNKEPNNLNNNTLNDDRRLYVWNTGVMINDNNLQNPIMRMSNGAGRYITFGTYFGNAGSGNTGQLKLIRNNDGLTNASVPQSGTTTNGTVVRYTNRFVNNALGVTPQGEWAVATSQMTSNGPSFVFAYNNIGLGGANEQGNNAKRYLLDLGPDPYRIRPRIAMQRTTAGTAPNASNPARAVLAYYDNSSHTTSADSYPIILNYGYFHTNTYLGGNFTEVTPTNGNTTYPTNVQVATRNSDAASSQHLAVGLLNDGSPVLAWYDSQHQCLWFSYGNALGTTFSAPTATTTTEWQQRAVKIKDYAGTHVDMAVDGNNGVHLAYVDARNGGLWYTYIPAGKDPSSNTTVRVDTYLSAGTKLMINVREQGIGNFVPYITYIHNAFAETKNSVRVAWRNGTLGHGTNEDHTFTGNWEVMTVPAENIPDTNEIVSNGVPTSVGTPTTTDFNGWAAPNGSNLRPYSSNGTGGDTNYMNRTILVGYMTDRWYEGAILKYNIITSP
jgi:hypothetical protein